MKIIIIIITVIIIIILEMGWACGAYG